MNEATTIHEACRSGDLSTVRRLVAADPGLVDEDDEHRWRPIFHAALNKHIDIVRLLIQSGTDLSAHDGYVLHYAAEVPNNQEVVTLLVQYGALEAHVRPVDDISRQLLAAIFLADSARVQSLLQLYPQLATQLDGRGDQAIHHAARNGETEIVRLLINAGADVNATTTRGHTVLYCAAGHGHVDTVRLLLECNVDIAARFSSDSKTVLEWLAQYPDDRRLVETAELISQK